MFRPFARFVSFCRVAWAKTHCLMASMQDIWLVSWTAFWRLLLPLWRLDVCDIFHPDFYPNGPCLAFITV